MVDSNPHFHLTVIQTAKLRIRVHMNLNGYTFRYWANKNGVGCAAKKLVEPSTWRVSYGVFRRIATALSTTPDKLYREISQ